MKKNQIFIKCGTEYKEMTKELLEACDLAGEIEKKFETKSSLIDNSEAEVDCFYSSDSVEKQNSEFGLYNMRIGIKPNLVAPMEAYWAQISVLLLPHGFSAWLELKAPISL